MKIRFLIIAISLSIFLCLAANLYADTVYLLDGSVIKGKITEETDTYIEITVGREGAQASRKISRTQVLRIEYGDENPTNTEKPKSESPTDPLEIGKKLAESALENFETKDYDSYLDNLTDMMKAVEEIENFKDAYKIIEGPLKKAIPSLLEDEAKRECNKVVHYAKFLRTCPTCKGAKKITKYENGKQKLVQCPTCKGKGGVDCPTCVKRIALAKKYRAKVRYTEEEYEHVAYFNIYFGDYDRKTVDRMLTKSFTGTTRYELDENDTMMKLEVTVLRRTMKEFLEELLSSGMNVTESPTTQHLYLVKMK